MEEDRYTQFENQWLEDMGFDLKKGNSIKEILYRQNDEFYSEKGISAKEYSELLHAYVDAMKDFLNQRDDLVKVSLFPGKNKLGEPEQFKRLDFYSGEIIAIVGPTGSGKSRVLEDIEFGANRDTPTGRKVLFNDGEIHRDDDANQRIIALLSQNMNFVIDLTVGEFLDLHGRCWNKDMRRKKEEILEMANELSGEPFTLSCNVAQLSGGQSRALMIADCALLSSAPIILIDEIENAGINRRKALEFLLGNDKLVFLTTHDPILALLAEKRLIIKQGGIDRVVNRKKEEEKLLKELEEMDEKICHLRGKLRQGEDLI